MTQPKNESPAPPADAPASSATPTVAATPSPPPAGTASTTVSSAAAGSAKATGEVSIGQLVQDASAHISTLVRGEIELAKLEMKSSIRNAGAGIALFVVALVMLVFAMTFGLIALAEGLNAAGIWRWAAFLIVFALLVAVAVACVALGIYLVKRVKAPARTIATGKETVSYLRHSRSQG